MTQKIINLAAAVTLIFSASALVLISAHQAGAQPPEACLQYVGCSH